MISKKNRLTRSRVQYTLKKGNKISDKFFSIKSIPSRSKENRFCVTVSLKVTPSSTTRNKLRRQIYEIIRLTTKTSLRPLDIVIITRPTVSKLSYKELEKNLTSILKKLNITI